MQHSRIFLFFCALGFLLAPASAGEQTLPGFFAASSRAERELETKFRAIPKPETCAPIWSISPRARTM